MGHSRQQLLSRIDRYEGSVEQAVYTLLSNMTDSEYETFVNRTVQDLVKQDILEKDSQHMAKGNAPINKTDSPMPEVGIIICDTCKDVGRIVHGHAGAFDYCKCKAGRKAKEDDHLWKEEHVKIRKSDLQLKPEEMVTVRFLLIQHYKQMIYDRMNIRNSLSGMDHKIDWSGVLEGITADLNRIRELES